MIFVSILFAQFSTFQIKRYSVVPTEIKTTALGIKSNVKCVAYLFFFFLRLRKLSFTSSGDKVPKVCNEAFLSSLYRLMSQT